MNVYPDLNARTLSGVHRSAGAEGDQRKMYAQRTFRTHMVASSGDVLRGVNRPRLPIPPCSLPGS